MKNKIILLLLISALTAGNCSFAVQEGKVISDKNNQNILKDSFSEVNQFTDSFFTPRPTRVITRTKKEFEDASKEELKVLLKESEPKEYPVRKIDMGPPLVMTAKTPPPLKRLRLKIQSEGWIKKKAKAVQEVAVEPENQGILDCDTMEYFPDKTELHANGNVVMSFPKNKSSLKADKMIYNQTSNLIKAYGNVVLINDGKQVYGDYLLVDLNEENAMMDNPASDEFAIRARAKKGYMYGDKLVEEDGSLLVTKKRMIDMRADMFGPDLDRMFVSTRDKSYIKKDSHGENLKIKTNDLIINSKKEHDTVTFKNAKIYMNEKKIFTIPAITLHTNKNRDYVEGDYPELGTVSNLGMYAGPGFVFDVPGGSTLKVLPILNYQSNGDNSEDNAFGWGGIAKFKSASNKTDIGYGTANKLFVVRGVQLLDDNLFLQYASNSYMDDWFLGFRMPKLGGELVYQDSTLFTNFMGKKKDMVYTQRYAAGYFQDGIVGNAVPLGEDGIGTGRLKYMGEVAQTVWSYNDENRSPVNARFEIVGEGSAAVYGTGDTQMIARMGPRLHSQYYRWMQDVGYFLSGYNDNTPLLSYDRYMYGRSNVYMRESFRINKYLTMSWMGSLNLSQDSWNGNLMQENSFFFGIGPDDIRLNIGYDTVRQQSFVTMSMHLDAKGSSIEYKKMVIKNPDTLGKDKKHPERQAFVQTNSSTGLSFASDDSDEDDGKEHFEKAQVIEIPVDEDKVPL